MLLRLLFRTVIEDSIYGYVRQEQIEPSYKKLSLVARKDVHLERKKKQAFTKGEGRIKGLLKSSFSLAAAEAQREGDAMRGRR
jgi:hypothetical protein